MLLCTSLRARLPRISFVSGDLLCRIRQKGIIRENNSSRKISGLCGKFYDIGSHILWSSVVAVSNSWKDVFNVSLQISYIIKAYHEVTIVSHLRTINCWYVFWKQFHFLTKYLFYFWINKSSFRCQILCKYRNFLVCVGLNVYVICWSITRSVKIMIAWYHIMSSNDMIYCKNNLVRPIQTIFRLILIKWYKYIYGFHFRESLLIT